MTVEIRVLESHEASVLERVAPGVFDHAVDPRWTTEFFADPRHDLAVALDADRVVGMASGVRYVHPDKPPELWINEVGVAPTYHGLGIGKRLLAALLKRAQVLGCTEAWVLTSPDNSAALRMYRAAGGEAEAEQPVMFTFRFGTQGMSAGASVLAGEPAPNSAANLRQRR